MYVIQRQLPTGKWRSVNGSLCTRRKTAVRVLDVMTRWSGLQLRVKPVRGVRNAAR
jgi:hypothetical protein